MLTTSETVNESFSVNSYTLIKFWYLFAHNIFIFCYHLLWCLMFQLWLIAVLVFLSLWHQIWEHFDLYFLSSVWDDTYRIHWTINCDKVMLINRLICKYLRNPFFWHIAPIIVYALLNVQKLSRGLTFKGQCSDSSMDHLHWRWGHYVVLKCWATHTHWQSIICQKNGLSTAMIQQSKKLMP